MLIDTHAHLASPRYEKENMHALIKASRQANVSSIVSLATNRNDWQKTLSIATEFSEVFAGIGIHPCDVLNETSSQEDLYARLEQTAQHPRCVCIGETGLDYYHAPPAEISTKAYAQRQEDLLHTHFRAAANLGKNIVLHTRDTKGQDSFDRAFSIYKNYAKDTRAVFHCFCLSLKEAEAIFALGGLVSFGGVLTFKNAQNVLNVATQCPEGYFMLETDAPYLAPVPHRGKINYPSYTQLTAQYLAKARAESIESLGTHTSQTACSFFNITL